MINEARFAELTAAQFGPLLLAVHDFKESSRVGYTVRYEAAAAFVQIDYDARRSLEANVWIGQLNSPEPPLALDDLLRATACPADEIARVKLMQTGDEAALDGLLASCARLLGRYGAGFLHGDPEAFAHALAQRSARALRHGRNLESPALIAQADGAWREHRYDRVYDLLALVRPPLDQLHLRRLETAERRRTPS